MHDDQCQRQRGNITLEVSTERLPCQTVLCGWEEKTEKGRLVKQSVKFYQGSLPIETIY